MSLTFGEQLKIVLKRRNMSVKELASEIEKFTGKPMSRQNLNQKLGRNNFQEKDMRMISEILGLTFTLDILGGEGVELPVEKVIEGNMTVAEVINLDEREKEEEPEGLQFVGVTPKMVEDNPELTAAILKAVEASKTVEAVTEEEKIISFERHSEEVQEPEMTELSLSELLREMEEIERDNRKQSRESRVRQEKWELQRKENGLVAKFGNWVKVTVKYIENEVKEKTEQFLNFLNKDKEDEIPLLEMKEEKTEVKEEGKPIILGDTKAQEETESTVETETEPAVETESSTEATVPTTEEIHVPEAAKDKDEVVGEINPYTGLEYENNSVRNHKNKIGYVQVYSRQYHSWIDMTEWAFLGYQEKRKVEEGDDYTSPIYLD